MRLVSLAAVVVCGSVACGALGQELGRVGSDTGVLVAQRDDGEIRLFLVDDGGPRLASPAEGLWSIATGLEGQRPAGWLHASPGSVEQRGEWLVLTGSLETPDGEWRLQDAYREHKGVIEGRRRFTWAGEGPGANITLSVRWEKAGAGARTLLPGICYFGNPSGVATGAGVVASFAGLPGEVAVFEEHRYPMPFASLEWDDAGAVRCATLHSLPSLAPHAQRADQWWSLGAIGRDDAVELTLLSGPIAINGRWGMAKANQGRQLPYEGAALTVPPGAVIEKTFYLEASGAHARGSAFRTPLRNSLAIFEPYSCDGLPSAGEIVRAKAAFAESRWWEGGEGAAGFRMYPNRNDLVMGWCGQAAAPGFALLQLADEDHRDLWAGMAQRSLDFLSTSPFNDGGFLLRFDPARGGWFDQDPVSQGQAMENFARAILVGRGREGVDTARWEAFLRRACEVHAGRMLRADWRPRSTSEAFLVSPLCKGFALFGDDRFRAAALKGAEHYAGRHLDMTEPYWGGTLDAQCEDKEGAWAGFQAFLAVYDMTGERVWLDRAAHAMDVVLSYTCVWDIDMPPGRLRDHAFRSRGWTVVSAQNQHLDVYGVMYTPEIYRMGELLGRDDLRRLAAVMYRSCGQLIDPFGSQGEQIQQTNFAQHGDLDTLATMRGGYSEGWTVFLDHGPLPERRGGVRAHGCGPRRPRRGSSMI